MVKAHNLTGQKFGRLMVESQSQIRTRAGRIQWNCVCDCGRKSVVDGNNLTRGISTSCGCFHKERVRETGKANATHELSRTKTYFAWGNMIQRCTNKKHPNYKKYGAKGIDVCQRWKDSFENFLADMGIKPPGQSVLKRIQTDKDYSKDNCRWIVRENSHVKHKVKTLPI